MGSASLNPSYECVAPGPQLPRLCDSALSRHRFSPRRLAPPVPGRGGTSRAGGKVALESGAMGYKVAVVGATGNVGREMLGVLAERSFPADEVLALASRQSQGTEVSFGDATLKVKALEHCDFSDV